MCSILAHHGGAGKSAVMFQGLCTRNGKPGEAHISTLVLACSLGHSAVCGDTVIGGELLEPSLV